MNDESDGTILYKKTCNMFVNRSNLLGTHFTVFDSGDSPLSRKGSILGNLEGASRKELAGIVYVSMLRIIMSSLINQPFLF